jgi:hypothetical protein
MATIKLEFPPLETKQQESVDRLLQTIGELMDVTFKSKQITIKQIEFDADRTDVASTVRRIIQTLKSQSAKLKEKVSV